MHASAPLVFENRQNQTIRGLRIAGTPDNCILLRNCRNITIEQCELGPASGEAVHLISCTSITLRQLKARDVRSGVYAVDSHAIAVNSCQFLNMQGPMPRGQFVQFDKVTGPGSQITSNTFTNQAGLSHPEDAINLYMSSGTSESPILVAANTISGGGPSPSGGGIMCGDHGGENIVVRENILRDPGQYGIAIAGGQHIQLLNNQISARSQPFTNVGIYVWSQSPGRCGAHTVRGNTVSWFNKDGVRNSGWNADTCGPIQGWDENNWNAPAPE